jgi:hypothetical protein
MYLYELEQTNKKTLQIVVSQTRRGLRRREDGGDLTNVQYKPTWNWNYESPLYNKYVLIKFL